MQTYLWVPPDSPPLRPRASISPLVIPEHGVEARSRRPSLHSSPAATTPSTQAQPPAADDAAQPPQPHAALPDVPWSPVGPPGEQARAWFGRQTAAAAATARKVAGPLSCTYRAPQAAQASLRMSVSVTAAGTEDEGGAEAGEAGIAAAPLPLPRRSMGQHPASVALSARTLLSYSSSQTSGQGARARDAPFLAGSATSYWSSLRYSRRSGADREQRSSVGPRAGGPPLSSVGCVRLRAYMRWAKGSGLAGAQAGPAAAHQAPFPACAQRGCATGMGPSSPPGCTA